MNVLQFVFEFVQCVLKKPGLIFGSEKKGERTFEFVVLILSGFKFCVHPLWFSFCLC